MYPKNQVKTIGILGGMGPRASAFFLMKFIEILNKRGFKSDTDFPKMIYLSLPMTDWDETGAKNKETVKKQVIDGFNWLKDAGVDIIAVPCNTVREFLPDDSLNIITETLKQVSKKKIGVICSLQTRESKLYEGKCEVIYPESQKEIDDIVFLVMSGETPDITGIVQNLFDRGAEEVILGCTELPLCACRLPTISSTESLVTALAEQL